MKLKGKFILRQIMGEIIVIPVGDSALRFNGMICIDPVGGQIWKGLEAQRTKEEILEDILEEFDVSREEAAADLDEFIFQLRESGLLED